MFWIIFGPIGCFLTLAIPLGIKALIERKSKKVADHPITFLMVGLVMMVIAYYVEKLINAV